MTLLGVACDDQIKAQSFPRLEVVPNPIVISAVAVGGTTSRTVMLRNAGGDTLVITRLQFSNAIDTREFSMQAPALPLQLDPGVDASLEIIYQPLDAGQDSGHLLIESNDADRFETRVPITTNFTAAELDVNPPSLEFLSDDGAPREQTVTITNLGTVPVEMRNVALADGTDEEFSLVTPNADLPRLAQGEAFAVTVRYTPAGGDTDVGTLVVETNLAEGHRVLVPLQATQPSPEIDVSPRSVVFSPVELNTESERVEVLIENQGTADLVIDGIALAAATPPPNNEQFQLHDLPDFAGGPLVLGPQEITSFGVSYFPQVEGSHSTAIVIRSNDEDEAILTVPLNGRVRQPCIQVLPGSIDLGPVALNIESRAAQLQIANCGDLPLTVSEITIDDPDFDWAPEDMMMDRTDVELPPLGTMPVRVWYTNRGLAEGVRTTATLTVHNSTVETPELEVPLIVTGGGAPTCDLRLLPARLDFGLVARGRNVSRNFNLVSRGTGHCEIRNQELRPPPVFIPGLYQMRFILTGRAPAGRIGPGAFEEIEVTYRPEVFLPDEAVLAVTYWDPFAMEERTTEATLTGVGGESNIEVIPGNLDFGRVTAGECASQEERVTVYNTGVVNLCITDLRLEGPNCDEFLIVDRPRADQDGCIIVTRNSPAEVRLVYEPANLGPDQCALIFESDANDNPELRVPLRGEGIRDRRQTDIFEQTSGRTVDVLFVIDNSGSMSEEQANLQRNFGRFIAGAAQFANDYQLGIVTTDMDTAAQQGKLQGNPRIMRRNPQIEQQFSRTADVGTNGSGEEKGLAAAHAALSDPLAYDTGVACNADADCVMPDRCVEGFCGGANRGFLREDAALEVIFVSDEDDYSAGSLNFFVDFFKNIKGFRNEGLFHAHAIVGLQNGRAQACNGAGGAADAGSRYVEVANRTNGQLFSICDDDFGDPLQALGNQAFGLPVQFFLSRPAVRNSIQVAVDGMRRAAGWQYDDPSNSVVFDDATVPQPGQTIQVDYEAQCFERRGN
ncbi:MAG: choice-of-anchor D domain-containing protein [Myxococcales bacterium]|nr:choice-of-anchor D domain-containing protein [Myxococcales bacterium]